jgi:hypothetical protein
MANTDDQTSHIARSRPISSELRGRQSVRATFKLTEECIGAISIVATHLGIKQKSLFDHLAEDIQALHSIARELKNTKLKKQSRIQKTFVISRKSLHSLDEISRSFNAPRDALVEYSVQRLLPIIIKEQQRHETRKKIFAEITAHFQAGIQLLKKINRSLDSDDPIFDRMAVVIGHYENTFASIEAFIEKSKIIETFDPEMLKRILTTKD